ncbi:hypothetical protein L195_g044439 [Trifolium pratense]|uniref:Uncharacterized protein n=1 Tax=Trifolium pratense TaxID=57577 RepID=A0A2K3MC27_TRIPR|nr:hypothetical protein L195_g044439 [Trifolium pratense]
MAVAPWGDSVTSILSRRAAIPIVAAAIDNRDWYSLETEIVKMSRSWRTRHVEKGELEVGSCWRIRRKFLFRASYWKVHVGDISIACLLERAILGTHPSSTLL